MEKLEYVVWGNSLLAWLTAAGITVGVVVLVKVVQTLLLKRLSSLAEKTGTRADDIALAVVRKTKTGLVFVVALSLGARMLTLGGAVADYLPLLTILALALQLALWLNCLVDEIIGSMKKTREAKDPASASTFGALSFLLKTAVWSLVAFLVLDNMGFDITAMVAGLGIGGIAIALAVQNILGDVFNSVAILVDKPFEVGDFIVIDQLAGTVEQIGIRTTRIRSLTGEEIIMSNSDLVESRIKNYKTMQKRRVVFDLGVTYQTGAEKLELIPSWIGEIIGDIDDARFDRCHFREFADSSLVFETVYLVDSGDYNRHVAIQQAINMGILRKFEENGVEFAYPTQTIVVENQSIEGNKKDG